VARLLLTTIAALSFAASSVQAAADQAGSGVNNCEDTISLYEPSAQNGRDFLLLGIGEWAFGYMTGLNVRAEDHERRDLGGFHALGIGRDILKYCTTDPEATIMEIVTAMYFNAPRIAPNVS